MAVVEDIGCGDYLAGSLRMTDNLSVFTTELTAILQALKIIKNKKISNYVIFSDSLSAIQALINPKNQRQDIVNQINKLNSDLVNKGNIIKFEWVPAHVGIPGNEMADKFAKEALRGDIELKTKLGVSELMSLAGARAREGWQRDWDGKVRAWHHAVKPRVDVPGPVLKDPRSTKILSRVRVGVSCALGVTKFKIGLANSPKCLACNTIEDMNHYLFHCILFEKERAVLTLGINSLGLRFEPGAVLNPGKTSRAEVFGMVLRYIGATQVSI
jgi:ribonuclease HI